MTAPLRAFSSLVAGGLALALVLAGCASAAGGSPAPESTADQNASDSSYAPRAAWLDSTALVLKVWGDGCAPQIGDLIAGEQSLEIVLVDGEDEVCAAVQTAHGIYLGPPASFDSSRAVELIVTDAGGQTTELTLPGLAAGEIIPADRMPAQTPAATWIDDDELAILTWGSSTCMPGSGTFEAVGETEGIIRLESKTDGICTMDLVPQITFVPAAGVAAEAALTLEGHVGADGGPVVLTVVK